MQLLKPDNGQSTSAQNTLTLAQEYRSNDMEILDYTSPQNAPPSVSRFEECRSLSETATQCCFDPIILVSVATQTDDVPTIVASDDLSNGSSLDISQASFTVPAAEWKTSHDHTYSMSVPIVYPTYDLDEDSLAPYTEMEVDPLLITLTMTSMTRSLMMTLMMSIKTQTGTYQMLKKSCSPMEMSPRKENQKVN